MNFSTSYVIPSVYVDAVIFQLIDNRLHVLLTKQTKQLWTLPGGTKTQHETIFDALDRTIHEKTGISFSSDLRYCEQLYTFDRIDADPQEHTISVAYTGYGHHIAHTDSEDVRFFPIDQLPNIAYGHADIIRYAHERLNAKLSYTNAVYAFLPKTFTLAELQVTYEAVFECELDKRNFRKKFLSLNLIHETEEMRRAGAHRPARLYAFNSQAIESLPRGFDGLSRNKI